MVPLRNALKRSVSAPTQSDTDLVAVAEPAKTLQTLEMLERMGYRSVWCRCSEVDGDVIQKAMALGWRISDAQDGRIKFARGAAPKRDTTSPTDKIPEPLPSPVAQMHKAGVSAADTDVLLDELLGPPPTPRICVSAPLEDAYEGDEGSSYFTFKPARTRLVPMPERPKLERQGHQRTSSKASCYSQDSDLSSIPEAPEHAVPPSSSRRSFRPPTPELRIGPPRGRRPSAPSLDRDLFFTIGPEDLQVVRRGSEDSARPESQTLPDASHLPLLPPRWRCRDT